MLPKKGRTEQGMWADNETDVDLLGFDYLVDNLFVALTEPRLLPVTVGLLGDWVSGKGSIHVLPNYDDAAGRKRCPYSSEVS